MKDFLLYVRHEIWCQGPEDVWEYFLVRAITLTAAKEIVKMRLKNVSEIKNQTIE